MSDYLKHSEINPNISQEVSSICYRLKTASNVEKEQHIKPYLKIKKVIFNHPATIVLWKDGTKTVVKANGEDFDPEKGLAMAIAKKALGNEGNYFNTIKKWTEPS